MPSLKTTRTTRDIYEIIYLHKSLESSRIIVILEKKIYEFSFINNTSRKKLVSF